MKEEKNPSQRPRFLLFLCLNMHDKEREKANNMKLNILLLFILVC